MKNVLLKPVFTDNGMINTINKRKRYVLVSIAGEYEIYRKDGLPDNDYTQDENDKYYLYVRFEDWAITLRTTKRYMTERIGFDTILKDRYNGDIMNRDKAFDEAKAKGKNKEFLAEEDEAISRIGSDPTNIAEWIHDYLEGCCNSYNYAKQFSKFPDFIGAILLNKLDEAIDLISENRSMLGAYQNRLQSAANNLTVMNENYEQSKSQIMDCDMAEESANMVKYQVLQQTSAAMLSQANNIPSIALQLLGQ